MAKTESKMIPLGTVAPDFFLKDVISNQLIHLYADQSKTATVIMFICNHCPYVKHINPALAALARSYQKKNIRFLAINSNDIEHYPDDSPEHMVELVYQHDYPFPYLFDETQEVAKAYDAACTPDFYVFNKDMALVYRGQFDDSRPGNTIPPTGSALSEALDCLLEDKPLPTIQKPSLGCNIKWK